MTLSIKNLKFLGLLILPTALIVGPYVGYEYYEKKNKEAEELGYATSKKWQWYDEYKSIQIASNERENEKKSLLRKVYMDKKYSVYALKDNDYKLNVMVKFVVDCDPGSEIITSKSYSDGASKKLICDEAGDGFIFYAAMESKDTNVVLEEDLDGFEVREDFKDWDFSKLDREITLLKATKTSEKEK